MSINLIESERHSQKSLRGAVVSVALHVSLITLAVYATASAGELSLKVPSDTLVVFYPPHPNEPTRTHSATSQSSDPTKLAPPHGPVIKFPIEIPDDLPTIEPPSIGAPAESLFSIGGGGNDVHGAASTTGSDTDEPRFASQVDKPAVARSGNPIPKYPSLLERSRIEGRVLVQFVVDTLGNAEMGSFKVLDSSNELFAQSLQATLPKWRFYPAEAGGRKVKQVVQLPLIFVAPHR